MTAEFGLFFLILAMGVALLQASYLWPSNTYKNIVSGCLVPAAWLQALCISLALATLVMLRLQSDFSVANVVVHSNRTLPTLYKIAGTWGNHEGSMLLWVWVLAMFGATLAMCHRPSDAPIARLAIGTQAIIGAGALAFVVFTSNPFARVFPPTADGEALNPLLQDIALSIHPPLLYLGYVGFSMVFSLAVAAMLHGTAGRSWAHMVHPWILASWSTLTLGIGLGSWWAYRVLGWGGFWFWDPVENASLLPWLSGTALLHANIVLKKRGQLPQWVLLLAILTFGMSMLGTFLVRSGVLVSVHSFASDPQRGLFILVYITLLLGSALVLFALRGHHTSEVSGTQPMLPLSREGMIVINNLFLVTACVTVLLGTIYPMLAEWLTGNSLSVGAPYFNMTALPLVAIPLVFAGMVPFMPWKKARMKRVLKRCLPALAATGVALLLVVANVRQDVAIAAMGIGLAIWLGAASLSWMVTNRNHSQSRLPVFFGHAGAALLIAGVTSASLWKEERQLWMGIGSKVHIGGYTVTLADISRYDTENHKGIRATLRFSGDGQPPYSEISPEYRLYAIRNSGNSIVDIHSTPLGDLYGVIGEPSANTGKIAVRLYYNPMIGLLWAGFVLMALGGVTSLLAFTQTRNRTRPL